MFADQSPSRGPTTSSTRLTETREVFEEALTHTVAERPAFLLRRCSHDAMLLRDVESLLDADAHVHEDRFIDHTIKAVVQTLRIRE